MSIYGPTSTESKQAQQAEGEQRDHSMFAKKPDVLQKAGGLMHGNIDMTGHKVVNLGDPVYGQDAATMRYVDTYATYLNNNKVNWTGGTMTGLLNMGSFKITNVGDPENDKDVVNKKYVDTFPKHDLDLDVIGRYLVISKNGNKNYVSLRTKKNIDLSNAYVNITEDIVQNIAAHNIAVISNITTVPNGNKLSIMQLNHHLLITPNVNNRLPEPWTFLFSAKFEEPLPNNSSILTFTTANQPSMYIYIMMWSSGTFKYAITDTVMTNQNAISIDIDTTQLSHIAFEYVGNKLTLWINGKSRKSHNVDLGELSDIRIDVHQLGVVSLYNRELSKTEIAEHFVEYQVKNFSNDEVLI